MSFIVKSLVWVVVLGLRVLPKASTKDPESETLFGGVFNSGLPPASSSTTSRKLFTKMKSSGTAQV